MCNLNALLNCIKYQNDLIEFIGVSSINARQIPAFNRGKQPELNRFVLNHYVIILQLPFRK